MTSDVADFKKFSIFKSRKNTKFKESCNDRQLQAQLDGESRGFVPLTNYNEFISDFQRSGKTDVLIQSSYFLYYLKSSDQRKT